MQGRVVENGTGSPFLEFCGSCCTGGGAGGGEGCVLVVTCCDLVGGTFCGLVVKVTCCWSEPSLHRRIFVAAERSWVGAGGRMAPAEERSAHKRHKPTSAASRKAAAAAGGGVGGSSGGGDPLKEVTGFAKTKKKEQDEVLTEMEVRAWVHGRMSALAGPRGRCSPTWRCVAACMGGSQGMKVHAWLYGLVPEGGSH